MELTPIKLFPFQVEDVKKLGDRKSSLIANEMGTGKTYEAIALDRLRRLDNGGEGLKTLVIGPLTTLESTWAQHYEDLAPELTYTVIDPKKRAVFLQQLKRTDIDVYIVHWEGVRILAEALQKVYWFHIIADEVHRAKNRKAQQTRALKKLRANWKTGMSGTPVTNKPQDLWSILHWMYPRVWTSYWRFYEAYVDYDIGYPHGYHVIKGPMNEKHLHEQIHPYFVRRTKEEVLPDLPEKYWTKYWVELTPKQRKAYNDMKKDMIAWLETQDGDRPLVAPVVIAQLIRLQQFAAAYATIEYDSEERGGGSHATLTEPSSKLDALMQILEDNPDEPIVVFSQFKQLIDLAAVRLQRAKIDYVRITGDVGQDDRRRAVKDFQAGRARIFLGTIAAGGEGITLTAASTVIFLDRDWSPAKNAQAEDRLHRIGQENAVQVIDIMARDTVDISRFERLEMKKDWIRRILGDT